jgi:hypothetical protein
MILQGNEAYNKFIINIEGWGLFRIRFNFLIYIQKFFFNGACSADESESHLLSIYG